MNNNSDMSDIFELLNNIRKRPEIYLGKKSVKYLYAFISGYMYCSYKNHASEDRFFSDFQGYVQKLYNITSEHNWANIIDFFSTSDEEAFLKFYKLFDGYKSKVNVMGSM